MPGDPTTAGEATTLPSQRSAPSNAPALPVAHVAQAPAPDADFELGETLGVGGMGRVILARQAALGRPVAAKFLRDSGGDPATLVREAIVTGRLEHPNIVPVHVLARTPAGEIFFSMKRVEGTPWNRALAAGQPLDEALEVFSRVCDAVAFAHARNVLHRDIKPANVLVGAFGEVYLVDWGIAVSLVPDSVLPLASSARAVGTPSYMAPEMATGDGAALSARSDVFLLGATLFEVLTGRPPHRGATPDEALQAAARAETPSFDPRVPAELAAICRRAMARDPRERYETATELKRAVTDYLRHREALAFFAQAQNRLAQLEQVIAHQRAGLEGSALGLTAHAAFSECRFGFEQVRRIWPEFDGARQGMQKALRLMVEHEAHHLDARAARILLAQLEAPPAELVAAVEAVEARAHEQATRLAELEREARDRELDVVLDEKRSFALAFGALVLAASVVATVFFPEAILAPTSGLVVLIFAAPVFSSTLLAARVKRSGEQNDAQRRLVNGLKASAWTTVGVWTIAWVLGVPANVALAFHLLSVASNWLIGAIVFHRRGVLLAGALLAALVAGLAAPRFSFLSAGVCAFVGFTAVGLTQRRRRPVA